MDNNKIENYDHLNFIIWIGKMWKKIKIFAYKEEKACVRGAKHFKELATQCKIEKLIYINWAFRDQYILFKNSQTYA